MCEKKINRIKENIKKKQSVRPVTFVVACSVLLMTIITAITFVAFRYLVSYKASSLDKNNYKQYQQYYAVICDKSELWNQIYNHAKYVGDANGICVDMFSERVGSDYSKADLMKIAIESGVDGIILEAENTDEMSRLISEADKKGICVVTLITDCPDSKRKSFVQAGAYNLGREYGEQVLNGMNEANGNVIVVMNSSNSNSTQNIVYLGIQDAIKAGLDINETMDVSALLVNSRDSFATEESIRTLFIDDEENTPDVIICLDEMSTVSVYQALIDYNRVGKTRLLGYYTSDTVLNGIEQGVIEATVSIDAKELGEYGVFAISEYLDSGYVSEYFSVGSEIINKSNVLEYRKREEQDR